MKKILLAFGLMFMLILIGVGYALVAIYGDQSELNQSSKAFVDQNIPPILSTWSSTNLMALGSEELQQAVSSAQMGLTFERYSGLGTLQSYAGAQGKAKIDFSLSTFKVVTAHYVADAQFEKGPARITVNLIKSKGGWWVSSFNIASPVFSSNELQHY
jgi:hypothetical protein